jgi:hypothetical protein
LQQCKAVLLELLLPLPDSVTAVAGGGSYPKTMGVSQQAAAGLVCDIEAREHLLKAVPGLVWELVERMFSTDDIELEFSCLVTGVRGYKPTVEIILGYLGKLDFMAVAHRTLAPALGFSLPASSKASYS